MPVVTPSVDQKQDLALLALAGADFQMTSTRSKNWTPSPSGRILPGIPRWCGPAALPMKARSCELRAFVLSTVLVARQPRPGSRPPPLSGPEAGTRSPVILVKTGPRHAGGDTWCGLWGTVLIASIYMYYGDTRDGRGADQSKGEMTKLSQTVVVAASLFLFGCSSNGTPCPPVGTGGITGSTGESVGGQTDAGGGTGGAGEIVASTGPVGGSTSTGGPGTTVPASTATGGKTAPASTATGGSSGGGNDTGAGQVTCSALNTGCSCSADKAGATDLAACSKTSVAKGEFDKGNCCKASDSCTCTSYSCVRALRSSYCICDTTYRLAAELPSGSNEGSCLIKDGTGYKCCHDSTLNRCTCDIGDCDVTATEVRKCDLALLTTCQSGQVAVDSCK